MVAHGRQDHSKDLHAFFDVSNWKAQDSHDLPRLVSFKENHRISLSL